MCMQDNGCISVYQEKERITLSWVRVGSLSQDTKEHHKDEINKPYLPGFQIPINSEV